MDKFLYIVNYADEDKSLCGLELKSIFMEQLEKKYIISEIDIDPFKSQFIRERLSLIYVEESLESLKKKIISENLCYEDFKVVFVKNEDSGIDYGERLKFIKDIGMCINGEADIYNPKIEFGVTKVQDKWIFGEYKKHDSSWHIHDKKPCTYSNGLNFKVARSLINIAVGGEDDLKLVDPCCGIGTVLLEGVSLGYNIKGYEINPLIGERAKVNLKFFDYEDVVTIMSMHDVDEEFDCSIVDIPYGLFNPITRKEQEEIISTSRKISKKMVIITYEKMDEMIKNSGFTIIDKCTISKGKFKRYITVCV